MESHTQLQQAGQQIPLGGALVIKVPSQVYQTMYSIAQCTGTITENRERVMRYLKNWILQSQWTNYRLLAFEDFSLKDAEIWSERTKLKLEWGMYLKLIPMTEAQRAVCDRIGDRLNSRSPQWELELEVPLSVQVVNYYTVPQLRPEHYLALYPRTPQECYLPPSKPKALI